MNKDFIEELNLNDKSLDEIPEYIFSLKNLKKLFLYKNNIKKIPLNIKDLEKT